MRFSFRTRLILSFLAIFFLGYFLASAFYRQIIQESSNALGRFYSEKQILSVEQMLRKETGLRSVESLQAWLQRIGLDLQMRITYLNESGQVIADSDIPLSEVTKLESFADRPEIAQALSKSFGFSIRPGSGSTTERIFIARRVINPEGIPTGILRTSAPLPTVTPSPGVPTLKFFFAFTFVLLLGGLLSWSITRRQARSVKSMAEATEAIAMGDFSKRVGFHAPPELFPAAYAIDRMAERIQSRLQTITVQKQQLEAILNGMEDGVMLLDSRGRIHTINRAFKNMGWGVSQIAGRRPLEVVRSPELQEACDRMVSSQGETDERPASIKVTLDLGRIFEINVLPIQDPGKTDEGAIVVFHDITEIRRLEKVRRDFVVNVSHEMRTPLTSIRGYAETLLDSDDCASDSSHSYLEIIVKHANHMSKMVKDLLELARLEAPSRRIESVTVDAEEALLSAWKSCSALADSKHIELESDISTEKPIVKGDQDELIQLFRNLFENAIRYSPNGEKITVSCRREKGMMTFGVRDNGPGIPKIDLPRVFERFYRVEKHRDSGGGSTGLGLAISRHIVLNHGGRIWVESPPKGESIGTAFYFTLPTTEEQTESSES